MTVDGDLTVEGLAQGAGVLAGDADRAATLIGEAGDIEDQEAIALGGQTEQGLDPLAVQVQLVAIDEGEKPLEALLAGAWDDLGEGVAILVGILGEQTG